MKHILFLFVVGFCLSSFAHTLDEVDFGVPSDDLPMTPVRAENETRLKDSGIKLSHSLTDDQATYIGNVPLKTEECRKAMKVVAELGYLKVSKQVNIFELIVYKKEGRAVTGTLRSGLVTGDELCKLLIDGAKALTGGPNVCAANDSSKAFQKDAVAVAEKTEKRQAGGLLDASTRMEPGTEKALTALADANVAGSRVKLRVINPKQQGYGFELSIERTPGKTETWYVSEHPYYFDQYPDGKKFEDTKLTFWMKDNRVATKMTQVSIPVSRVLKNGNLDALNLMADTQQAIDDRESEIKDNAKVAAFDLPKNEPIGYIGMVESAPDVVMRGMTQSVKHWPRLMNERGYQFVGTTADCNDTIVVDGSEAPVESLKKKIRKYKEMGVKNVYWKPVTHGNDKLLGFCTEMGPRNQCKKMVKLTKEELTDVLSDKEFFGMKVFIEAPPCGGGGFASALAKFKDPDPAKINGRVTLFLMSKLDGVSEEGRLQGVAGEAGQPKVFSSYYETFFLYYMSQPGYTFGKAHRMADLATKRYVPSDAEVWVSSPNGGVSTKGISSPNQ